MKIRLLNEGYKNNEQFYKDFLGNQIINNEDYFSDEIVNIEEAPDFPVYMGIGSEKDRKEDFLRAFDIISKHYIDKDREVYLNGTFWHSLLCVYKRDYILQNYPEVKTDIKKFRNIVLKKFDWENYIYKCALGAQYISDNIDNEDERKRYYNLIVDNLDLYNYIIKYKIFRNDKFLINILDIIDDWGLSTILKSKIKDRDDLGDDERIGRRVIFEFNKSYPIVMSPMLDKEELEILFIKYLSYYTEENYYASPI